MLADIKNTGPRAGGSITAALFLKEFIETDKITDFRTAAFKAAIEKIALSYDFIGL